MLNYALAIATIGFVIAMAEAAARPRFGRRGRMLRLKKLNDRKDPPLGDMNI